MAVGRCIVGKKDVGSFWVAMKTPHTIENMEPFVRIEPLVGKDDDGAPRDERIISICLPSAKSKSGWCCKSFLMDLTEQYATTTTGIHITAVSEDVCLNLQDLVTLIVSFPKLRSLQVQGVTLGKSSEFRWNGSNTSSLIHLRLINIGLQRSNPSAHSWTLCSTLVDSLRSICRPENFELSIRGTTRPLLTVASLAGLLESPNLRRLRLENLILWGGRRFEHPLKLQALSLRNVITGDTNLLEIFLPQVRILDFSHSVVSVSECLALETAATSCSKLTHLACSHTDFRKPNCFSHLVQNALFQVPLESLQLPEDPSISVETIRQLAQQCRTLVDCNYPDRHVVWRIGLNRSGFHEIQNDRERFCASLTDSDSAVVFSILRETPWLIL